MMLACTWFSGLHTANVIAEQFGRTIATFDLTDKILHIFTENAPIILQALSFLGFVDVALNVISVDSNDDYDDDDADNAFPKYSVRYPWHLSCLHVFSLEWTYK